MHDVQAAAALFVGEAESALYMGSPMDANGVHPVRRASISEYFLLKRGFDTRMRMMSAMAHPPSTSTKSAAAIPTKKHAKACCGCSDRWLIVTH